METQCPTRFSKKGKIVLKEGGAAISAGGIGTAKWHSSSTPAKKAFACLTGDSTTVRVWNLCLWGLVSADLIPSETSSKETVMMTGSRRALCERMKPILIMTWKHPLNEKQSLRLPVWIT